MDCNQDCLVVPADRKLVLIREVKVVWGWLGNMSPHAVVCDGLRWPTAEHLFQSLRLPAGHPARDAIRTCASPMRAKMVAKKHAGERVVEPLSELDVANMRQVVRLKFEQNLVRDAEFARQVRILRGYGNPLIVEDCSKRPHGSATFWGAAWDEAAGTWRGRNRLGRIWMELLS